MSSLQRLLLRATAKKTLQEDTVMTLANAFSADAPLVLIGCGKMGGALLEGWLAAGVPGAAVHVVEPHVSDALQAMASEHGVSVSGNVDAIGVTPRAVLLAVKPQMMGDVLPTVAAAFGEAPLYLSIAAGTSIETFAQALGASSRIVRVMPNTPVAVAKGASALFANGHATPDDRKLADGLMAATGIAVWIDAEDQMDAVTGVSGSGPAYVFHMIEALAAAGEAEGLAPELAMQLARQTVIGAAALADASGEKAETLRVNVTSPGGTTAAALAILMDNESGFSPLMVRGVNAAAQRSRELKG